MFDKSKNSSAPPDPFRELKTSYDEAMMIVNHKLKYDKDNLNIWESAKEQLDTIDEFIKKKQIPSDAQKQKINLGIMLAKSFSSPEESAELSPLFKLSNQFLSLGSTQLSNDDALKLYKKLTSKT
jgi:hypothetical protein